MKSILASVVALILMLAVVITSPSALARSPELEQVEQIVDVLEAEYTLNISLIPQVTDSERIWLKDLKDLTNIMDNRLTRPDGSLRSLHCDKLVCRARDQ